VLLTAAIVLLLGLLVFLVALFVVMVTPPGVTPASHGAAPEMSWVRSLYGFGPAASQQMRSPSSVAIAPSGDIYVADPTQARVFVFSPSGTFRRLIYTGGQGTRGQLLRPEAVAVDATGNAYVADSWAGKVIVFDPRGRFLREWPADHQPRGIAVDGDRVYVLDVGEVVTYDTSGKRLGSFGSRGRKPGQIDAYLGITAKDRRIYVADSYNRRVEAFDSSGTLVWSTPSTQTAGAYGALYATSTVSAATTSTPAGFAWDLPQDVALDGNGHLLVVDAFRFDVTVLDASTGRVLKSYGTFGQGEGQFFYPTSIAYDPVRDWFAVADTNNNRVQVLLVPGSAKAPVAEVWRAAASPYRYLLAPALVLLGAIAFALWLGWRVARMREAPSDQEQAL